LGGNDYGYFAPKQSPRMVLGVRTAITWLALAVSVLGVASEAEAAPRTPPYLRTSLDEAAAPSAPAGPRRIRRSLDDESQSRAAFPLDAEGRLIRLSLGEGTPAYGRLNTGRDAARRIRITLE
jgi:hypothetical protein